MDREDIERIRAIEEKLKAQEGALKLQAREYERRLKDLNHAHAKHEQFVAKFPSKLELISVHEKIELRMEALVERIATLEGRSMGRFNAGSSIYAVVAIVIAALALIKTFL
jgi:hypothetical protein